MTPPIEAQPNSFNVTESMLLSLSRTKPWARLLSIVGFICIGFMVIAGAVNMVVFSKAHMQGGPIPGIMFVVLNILMGVLYFFPSLFLFKFSASIGRLLNGGGATEMEEALSNQKSFWKFMGILTLMMFGFGLIGIVAAIVIPQFARVAG